MASFMVLTIYIYFMGKEILREFLKSDIKTIEVLDYLKRTDSFPS